MQQAQQSREPELKAKLTAERARLALALAEDPKDTAARSALEEVERRIEHIERDQERDELAAQARKQRDSEQAAAAGREQRDRLRAEYAVQTSARLALVERIESQAGTLSALVAQHAEVSRTMHHIARRLRPEVSAAELVSSDRLQSWLKQRLNPGDARPSAPLKGSEEALCERHRDRDPEPQVQPEPRNLPDLRDFPAYGNDPGDMRDGARL